MATVDRGIPRAAVVEAFSVLPATVERWLKKRRETDGVEPEPIPGPPAHKREALPAAPPARAKANPHLTLAEHRELFEEAHRVEFATATVSRAPSSSRRVAVGLLLRDGPRLPDSCFGPRSTFCDFGSITPASNGGPV